MENVLLKLKRKWAVFVFPLEGIYSDCYAQTIYCFKMNLRHDKDNVCFHDFIVQKCLQGWKIAAGVG